MLQDMFSWANLGTTAGATAAVMMIVQWLKLPIKQAIGLPTRG
jgi:hypothetical protein